MHPAAKDRGAPKTIGHKIMGVRNAKKLRRCQKDGCAIAAEVYEGVHNKSLTCEMLYAGSLGDKLKYCSLTSSSTCAPNIFPENNAQTEHRNEREKDNFSGEEADGYPLSQLHIKLPQFCEYENSDGTWKFCIFRVQGMGINGNDWRTILNIIHS
jgi:hypothetical protein